MSTNKALDALRSILPGTPTNKPGAKPEPGPRIFTQVERMFLVLAAMMMNGTIVQKENVTGPKSKTFLSVTSWRVQAIANKITGVEGHYSRGKGGKGPRKWVEPVEGAPLQGYYLNLAEDYIAAYGKALETPAAKAAIAKVLAA